MFKIEGVVVGESKGGELKGGYYRSILYMYEMLWWSLLFCVVNIY